MTYYIERDFPIEQLSPCPSGRPTLNVPSPCCTSSELGALGLPGFAV